VGGLEPPRGAALSASVEPGPGESLDRLSLRRRVLQRARGHRSATDDLLAVWQAARARPDARRVLDLGCGHGTVTLLLSDLLPEATFVSVEAQAVSAALAERNMALNGLTGRVDVVCSDFRDLQVSPEFDLVTGTPPFMPVGTGVLPADPQRAAGRFELRGGIEDYVATGARALAERGAVCTLMDAAQDGRCRAAYEAAGLAIERALVVHPGRGKGPRYRGYVGGHGSAEAGVESLHVRDDAGEITAAYAALRRFVGVDR